MLDAIDFFSFDARRLIFREARKRGIWAITSGPVGFSAVWIFFDPQGMDFDTYFGVYDGMSPIDQYTAFAMGVAPAGTHWGYYDLSEVKRKAARAPSVGLACQLSSGVTAMETAKIILGRKPLAPPPITRSSTPTAACFATAGYLGVTAVLSSV